jgi:drug/metabolite transporter (DMT)-like permease
MNGSRRRAYLPFVALAVLALVWGYNWVVMKVGVRYSDPFTFSALRNLLGALALFALVAMRRGSLRSPGPLWVIAVFGVFQTSLSGLGVWALYLGSAGKTSVLTYTMPFWLLLIAWPILGERIHGVQWAVVVLALAGLVCVLAPWNIRGLWAGLLAIMGGLAWATASVLFKVIRKHHQVELLPFTAWQALLGSIPLIIAAALTAQSAPVWNASFVEALLYNVFVASAVAWLLWLYVLHNLHAGTAGISSLAIPVVGVLAAWIQLGERPGIVEGIGIALIVAALAVLTARGLLTGREAPLAAPDGGRGADSVDENGRAGAGADEGGLPGLEARAAPAGSSSSSGGSGGISDESLSIRPR